MDNRRPTSRVLREPCACGGPDIVATGSSDDEIFIAVDRHRTEPVHQRWAERQGFYGPAVQAMSERESIELQRELVGGRR